MKNNKLRLSKKDIVICGVCGGLAEYFDVETFLVRLLAFIFLCSSLGTAVLLYFIFAIIIPNK